MLEILDNRAFIALISAAAGVVIAGVINFVLQWLQDRRRFKNEHEVQERRWQREDEVQRQRWAREEEIQQKKWDREDEQRNYEARRRMYSELLRATDDSTAVSYKEGANRNDAREYADTTARLRGELRAVAPATVRIAGEDLLHNFMQYVYALYAPLGQTEAEARKIELAKRRLTFIILAQQDLGLLDEASKKLIQKEYEGLRQRKPS